MWEERARSQRNLRHGVVLKEPGINANTLGLVRVTGNLRQAFLAGILVHVQVVSWKYEE
jgi:hypothetical protein